MRKGLRRCRSAVELADCGTVQGDTFQSQWYQGLCDGMEWLRLSLTASAPVQVAVWAADEPAEGTEPALTAKENDLLLYGVRGRFLRFQVRPAQALRSFEILFPARSIDEMLPGVLQGDPGLRRLLGAYQSAYMDLNRQAAGFPERLNPLNPDALPALARWLGASRWMRRGAPRELLAEAPTLHRVRGTAAGLERLVSLVTGKEGRLLERFRWEHCASAQGQQDCLRLFGNSADAALLLPADSPPAAVRVLESLLPDFLPLGIECRLLVLEDGAPLDALCFLDENAALAEPPPPMLDEVCIDDLILE